MKIRNKIITTCLTAAGLLAVATFVSLGQKTFAQSSPDPTHAAHVAAGQMGDQSDGQTVEAQMAELRARIEQLESGTPQQSAHSNPRNMPMGGGNSPRGRTMSGMGSGARPAQGIADMNMTGGNQGGTAGGYAVADQMAELRVKMQRLETTVQQQSEPASDAYRGNPSMDNPRSGGAMPMGGKPGMGPGKRPMQGKMAGMGGNSQSGAKPAMSGGAMPASGGMAMMNEKMDNMMGMMSKMMGDMDGGAPAGTSAHQHNP